MDRFSRTREYYLRGTHRDCPSETPSAPPVADLAFDFDFMDSKLDLSFDVGSPVAWDDSKTSSLTPSDTNEGVGMALSDGLPYQRREHLDHLATREDGHNCGQRQNECISSGPIYPSETHIKFSGRCERPAKNLPPCSIYSREWRQRVRLTATSPEETSDHVSAELANSSLKETSNDTTTPAPPQQVKWDETDQESVPVPVPAPGPKDVYRTNEGWPFPTNTSLEADVKKHRKRFPLLRKWLLRPKKHLNKKVTLSSADAGVEKVPLDTNTSCANSLLDTPNPQPFPRIGNALRKRVAQKQAVAQDQISLPRRPTGSLRGGGNLNSIQKGRQWDNDQGAYNRRGRDADRHESSGGIASVVSLVTLDPPEINLKTGTSMGLTAFSHLHKRVQTIRRRALRYNGGPTEAYKAMKMTEEDRSQSDKHGHRLTKDLNAQRNQVTEPPAQLPRARQMTPLVKNCLKSA
ncbi:shugoshin family protein [Fonsecaea nubica]|uniref:Shugoshin family protein n=1 Tax=Fonsecaea nubica TaxID=856822 RepID=A0A178DDJ2_9EURO|nr:shugoshin family protein [Fonsecaea nubica]OAL40280.1 shugoshin family protein [Fonsecaea nubica]